MGRSGARIVTNFCEKLFSLIDVLDMYQPMYLLLGALMAVFQKTLQNNYYLHYFPNGGQPVLEGGMPVI